MFKDAPGNAEQPQAPSELDLLKQKARLMGVEFSNNIGLETLKERIQAKEEETSTANVAGDSVAVTTSISAVAQTNALETSAAIAMDKVATDSAAAPEPAVKPKSKKQSLRQQMFRENMRLIRCRIQNLDPKKAALPGEVFTVANEYLGTVRKFIPYGEVTDDGYHIPYWVYKQLVKREFLNIRTRKDKRTGTDIVETKWAREFAIEILPPLTQEELDTLKQAQIAAGSIE